MRLLHAPIGIMLALLAPATSLAQTLASRTHTGMSGNVKESSTCATHAGSSGTDRVVTCGGLLSKAVVRFDFTVPATTKGVGHPGEHRQRLRCGGQERHSDQRHPRPRLGQPGGCQPRRHRERRDRVLPLDD
jgi:hypothetical protein